MQTISMRATLCACICARLLFADAREAVLPIDSGYGAEGSHEIVVDSIVHSSRKHDRTYIYCPGHTTQRLPVVFFLYGLGSRGPSAYVHIVEHLARRGLCVVYPEYRLASFPGQRRTYRKLFSRLIKSVARLGTVADTTRIGFAGHSFGGAAIPALALRCIRQLGWGVDAAFMFIMAPHFVFGITEEELRDFPPHVKLIVEVYEDDDCNDHRIAKHLFETIGIPHGEKEYVLVVSDSSQALGKTLVANHGVPYGSDCADGKTDGLDYYAVYRLLDALADYTFRGTAAAREVALGDGGGKQRYMGTWRDGRPVEPALAGDEPVLLKPVRFYQFHWEHPWNPHNPRRRTRKFLLEW